MDSSENQDNTTKKLLEFKENFEKKRPMLWYHPRSNYFKKPELEELKQKFNFKPFTNWEQLLAESRKDDSEPVYVVVTGLNGEEDTDIHEELKQISNIESYNLHSGSVTEVARIKQNFPAFVPVFNDPQRELSYMYKIHNYLIGFTNSTNIQDRAPAKKHFIELARYFAKENIVRIKEPGEIELFDRDYTNYDGERILEEYMKNNFLCYLINNCLRMATADSILYTRFVIRDMENAIREKFRNDHLKRDRLLYRRAPLTSSEIRSLKENEGRDIEMHGFLSTSKKPHIAWTFGSGPKCCFITIIVPDMPKEIIEELQGYADLKDIKHSKEEEEVLFNIRSRFRIERVSLERMKVPINPEEEKREGKEEEKENKKGEEEVQHIVLLYGAQEMRKYIVKKEPHIILQISKEEDVCSLCRNKIQHEEIIHINVEDITQISCQRCLKDARGERPLSVWLRMKFSTLKRSHIFKIPGFLVHLEAVSELIYAKKNCRRCEKQLDNTRIQCLDCPEYRTKEHCKDCEEEIYEECLLKNHHQILTNVDYDLWRESMRKGEELSIDHHREVRETLDIGKTFVLCADYEKAITHYEHEKLQYDSDAENKARTLMNLAEIYNLSDKKEQVEEYYLEAITLIKETGKLSIDLIRSYYKLAGFYRFNKRQEKYRLALKLLKKALKICNIGFREAKSREELALTADVYNELAFLIYYMEGFYFGQNYTTVEEVVGYLSHTFEIRRNLYGFIHPDVAKTFNDTAIILRDIPIFTLSQMIHNNDMRNYFISSSQSHSITLEEEALRIRLDLYGKDHLETARSYNNLANSKSFEGMYEEAEKDVREAVRIREAILGTRHSQTIASYKNLIRIYNCQGKIQEAENYYFKVFDF